MSKWDDIVREHGLPSYRVAWRILRHAHDCEDVLQEVFIEAHRLFIAGEVTHWRTFLNRMVTYRALDLLRQRRPMNEIGLGPISDNSPSPEQVAIYQEEAVRVREIVAELPPRQAAVFCLAHFEELTHDEIAATLEISVNAVGMALHKARANLRSAMMEHNRENN